MAAEACQPIDLGKCHHVDVVVRYREAGMSEFLMEAPHEHQFAVMERIALDVLPGLRPTWDSEVNGGGTKTRG